LRAIAIRLKRPELWATAALCFCITIMQRLTFHFVTIWLFVTFSYPQISRYNSGERKSSRLRR